MKEKMNWMYYDPMSNEFHFYKTEEEAKKALYDEDFDEGIPDEFDGGAFVAKITNRSKIVEMDHKTNYCQCEDDSCLKEHWPYFDGDDCVGDVVWIEQPDDATTREQNKNHHRRDDNSEEEK